MLCLTQPTPTNPQRFHWIQQTMTTTREASPDHSETQLAQDFTGIISSLLPDVSSARIARLLTSLPQAISTQSLDGIVVGRLVLFCRFAEFPFWFAHNTPSFHHAKIVSATPHRPTGGARWLDKLPSFWFIDPDYFRFYTLPMKIRQTL